MSGTTSFVIVIVLVFVGAMMGMLVYMNSGKDDPATKEKYPTP